MSGPRPLLFVWLAVLVAVGACTAPGSLSGTPSAWVSSATSPSAEALAEPAPGRDPVPAGDVLAAAEKAAAPGMTLGVAVLDVTIGELAVGRDGEREFMSASLCKVLLAVDVLDRARAGGRPVETADLELLTRALSDSDDGAMNVLWGRFDGAGAVGRVATRLDLGARLPSGSAETWGDTTVSAADMVTLYRHVLRDMAPPDGAVIVGALSAASAVAADGFAQHYGLLHEGASPRHYAKQAWVPYSPAGYLLHSAGVAYDHRTGHAYAIALLSIQTYSSAEVARNRLSTVAAAAMAALAG